MTILAWIITSGILMSCIALVGAVTLLMTQSALDKILLPLVAFAAGSLIGGAVLHMLPAAVTATNNDFSLYLWLLAGFMCFFALEQFLNWHHSHSSDPKSVDRQPLTYMILIADALHNFIGGMSVAASFLISVPLGITAWLAAAAHEVPQELGDFGVLVHGGWDSRKALLFNFLSAWTFLLGGLIAYLAADHIEVVFLVPFAAGNFIYIAAADLIPEIKKSNEVKRNLIHFLAFSLGIGLLLAVRWLAE
ncbi:Zinc transporter ZupT [Rubripirellula lacrimiformis]|uniref:Zinc transporter ZupT n=1 Tax=Rubripirellula lacrimiformis TaxID=1930273 RepID=A0A517N4L2_9BACT|nr:ZIP family metal transporter [Rubripirellula lacrimiformis]QDT01948.1 Zinc transporter ZupT [Rubripirellula lacrimiformis]